MGARRHNNGKKTFGYLGVMEKRVIFASGIYIYK
jgi:hypothetical protein